MWQQIKGCSNFLISPGEGIVVSATITSFAADSFSFLKLSFLICTAFGLNDSVYGGSYREMGHVLAPPSPPPLFFSRRRRLVLMADPSKREEGSLPPYVGTDQITA